MQSEFFLVNLCCQPGESAGRNLLSVYFDSFLDSNQVWRSIKSGFPPCMPQDRFRHGGDASFAIGSGDVKGGEFPVWIAQCLHHGLDPVQTQMDSQDLVPAAI